MSSDGLAEAQLTVTVPAGPVLAGSLVYLTLLARTRIGGELLSFTYRDPFDPEAPDVPRPLRRARLVVVDDGPVPGVAATLAGTDRSITPKEYPHGAGQVAGT